jgi:hypothetical protein
MLQMGSAFTLLPRLRAAESLAAARRVLLREIVVIGGLALLAAGAIFLAAPLIFDELLAGKYEVTTALLVATLLVGGVKLSQGFTTTIVLACGTQRDLAVLSWFSLASLAVAGVATYYGSRMGLAGIIYGVGLAWSWQTVAGGVMASRCMRLRYGAPS